MGLWFRFGHWYLVAWDLDRAAVRTFRVDRIEGEVTRGEAGDAEVPEDVDVEAALPDEPWEVEGEDRIEMRIRVDALEARRVADEVGQDKVVRAARRRVRRPRRSACRRSPPSARGCSACSTTPP